MQVNIKEPLFHKCKFCLNLEIIFARIRKTLISYLTKILTLAKVMIFVNVKPFLLTDVLLYCFKFIINSKKFFFIYILFILLHEQ